MINNQRNPGKESKRDEEDQNLRSNEMGNTSNAFLGQMGHEQEGKTESFQGNWTGDYGNGFIGGSRDESTSGDFVSQASNTGNGLNSDEDDLLASGQNVDDLGLGNNIKTTGGKAGENDSSAEGSKMPDPEDTTDQKASADEDSPDDEKRNEGPGLATSGDFASMTGQNIDDLNLPSAADVAGWRQDGGTIGQDSADKDVVDTGEENTVSANSGEFTTGKADTEGGWGQYPNAGDLGQVDPGQQNYVEDQDTRKAFRAGDFKTSQEEDPEEGLDKYARDKTKPSGLDNLEDEIGDDEDKV